MNTNGASLNCVGCTIILTNFDDPANTGNIRLTGGTLNITAPTRRYRTRASRSTRIVWRPTTARRAPITINGNSTSGVRGRHVHARPVAALQRRRRRADDGKCMQIVAKRVEFTGNSAFKMGSTCADAGLRGHTGGGHLVRLVA